MTPQQAWRAAYHQLELQLDSATFETWLRKAVLLRVEDTEPPTYVIGCEHTYAQDMLRYRLYKIIWRILIDVLEIDDIQLSFEIHKDPTPRVNPFDEPSLAERLGEEPPRKRRSTSKVSADAPPMFRYLDQVERTPDLPETSYQDKPPAGYHWAQPQKSAEERALEERELSERMTFERFMVNASNQVVYEAALSVAEHTANIYNPFLIYGGVGLGKTHLLQSIAHVCRRKGLHTIYIPSEVFTNDLVHAIRHRTTAMFREKYRSVDVLLVDDIQFITGKETTQEEFFHTFNALVNYNKQIVLASDRHPGQLKTLEDRLRSRFQGGLVADIQPPEYETRVAIMKMWAQERGAPLDHSTIEMIAERAPSNVRELEGVFNQVVAQAQIARGPVTIPLIETTLERFNGPREPQHSISLEHIIAITAHASSLTPAELRGKRRTARINTARQIAMYLARELTEYSLPKIGIAFGGRSHTTILHGANKIQHELEVDPTLESRVLKIRRDILGDGRP